MDASLAHRLEYLSAQEMRRFAQTARAVDETSGAEWLSVAGGVAAFVRDGSPVNMAAGLGFEAPVEEADIQKVTRFYEARETRAVVSVCPLADPSLIERLSEAGYRPDGFENVLIRALGEMSADVRCDDGPIEIVEAMSPADKELWALVAATGFSAPLPPLEQQLHLASVVVSRPGVRLLVAFVDGKAAGTGEIYIDDGVAWLSADATLPQFRRRGVQRALQAYRLDIARAAGCEMAVSEAAPGSTSQRNMERMGFTLAYTRLDMVGPGGWDRVVV